jgi:hypothetical protein
MSIPDRPFFPGSFCHNVLVVSPTIVSPVPCYLCTVGHPPAGCGQFLSRSTISLGPNFPEDVSLAPCHCCTTEHFSAGGSQLPSESTIRSLCRFLSPPTGFTAARSLVPPRIPFPQELPSNPWSCSLLSRPAFIFASHQVWRLEKQTVLPLFLQSVLGRLFISCFISSLSVFLEASIMETSEPIYLSILSALL